MAKGIKISGGGMKKLGGGGMKRLAGGGGPKIRIGGGGGHHHHHHHHHGHSPIGYAAPLIVAGASSGPPNLAVAYVLALLGLTGICGLHRMYLGKWGTGILWLLTFGLLGIGQLVDLFLLPSMVDQAAKAFVPPAAPAAAFPPPAGAPLPGAQPGWGQPQQWGQPAAFGAPGGQPQQWGQPPPGQPGAPQWGDPSGQAFGAGPPAAPAPAGPQKCSQCGGPRPDPSTPCPYCGSPA